MCSRRRSPCPSRIRFSLVRSAKRCWRRVRLHLEGADLFEGRAIDELADEWLGLGKVLVDIGGQQRVGAELRCHARLVQEGGQAGRDDPEGRRVKRPARHHRRRARRFGQAAHVDGPVHNRTVADQRVPRGAPVDRFDPQVDVGGQPPVETDLVLAATPAGLDCPEVEEPEVDRTFDLPDVLCRQEDPRTVGHAEVDGARGRRPEGLGPAKITG